MSRVGIADPRHRPVLLPRGGEREVPLEIISQSQVSGEPILFIQISSRHRFGHLTMVEGHEQGTIGV